MSEKVCDLVERLNALSDPRRQCQNLKHQLVDVLVLGFCGVLAGCDDFVEIATWAKLHLDFFRTFLQLLNGIPSHDTFTRVFSAIPSATLQGVLLPWLGEGQAENYPPLGFFGLMVMSYFGNAADRSRRAL